jgi:hypothetical protein
MKKNTCDAKSCIVNPHPQHELEESQHQNKPFPFTLQSVTNVFSTSDALEAVSSSSLTAHPHLEL